MGRIPERINGSAHLEIHGRIAYTPPVNHHSDPARDGMISWKTLSRTQVLRRGKFLTLEDHDVELPDGRVIEGWPWLVMPDYVNIMAETPGGEFVCFRQTKYAIGEGTSLAPVGGYVEPGEAPGAAARRELLEETGYEAPEWISLGSYVADGNRGGGTAHLFLARGARKTGTPGSDDLEEQELQLLGRGELEDALAAGEFKVLAWCANVALALLHIDRAR
jgi:ADP-ribose pyrophosphatase